jgi:hypothetical protein
LVDRLSDSRFFQGVYGAGLNTISARDAYGAVIFVFAVGGDGMRVMLTERYASSAGTTAVAVKHDFVGLLMGFGIMTPDASEWATL